MIRILVADDHPIVRKGLRQIVQGARDIAVAGEASDGRDMLRQISKGHYDVLVLDISLGDQSGLDIVKRLRKIKSKLPILILSMHPAEEFGVRALKAGASGYLSKESMPDELIAAIRKVAQGGKYVSSSLAEKLALDLDVDGKGGKQLHEALSDREFQVMRMIASGTGASDIARALSLSVKTISTYRSRILLKMRVKNNAGIMRYAMKNGLVL